MKKFITIIASINIIAITIVYVLQFMFEELWWERAEFFIYGMYALINSLCLYLVEK